MGCLSDLIASSLIAKSQFLQWSSPITLKSGVKLVLELVVGEQQGLGAIDDDGSILDM
ncbi:hypothetical protein Pmar_PMAR022637 [Perkinsus marinus ATCC 50983]|uniref:Uncharacterized protein n=1 Tax=Perkinsus marinus (strain ATCC 50983 / TXsc) TaxID=423536 RepID=C5L9J1_PERM5|nr:hypothetical protein Pmar_PMAR022637 [Perkinsus marinus ATCC 50983]EER06584.1 hypothetical protein Pmar_PMAR022637 [Perkinsus marinus ATCC 50983]|eukprot:XP_002774768.1 hypothetical protein Pmar_PMAR022637 [Perkinsus marinus ATCC 50983]